MIPNLHFHLQRFIFGALLLSLMLLTCAPAHATNYSFSAAAPNLPPTCSGSNSTYVCTEVTLASGDTITIVGTINITINSNLTVGSMSQINIGGSSSNLNFFVGGLTYIGAGSSVVANINSIGVITTGANLTFVGNLKTLNAAINVGDDSYLTGYVTTSQSGVINIGSRTVVTGNLTSNVGAINVGRNSTVGSVTTKNAGAVTIGDYSVITGNLTSGIGAVVIGDHTMVKGDLSTQIGAITIGDFAFVGGLVNNSDGSTAGAVVIGDNSVVVGAILAGAGAITTGTNTKAIGVSTIDGAITLGDGSLVGGSICSGNSGAITVGANSQIAGNVMTLVAGAITVGVNSAIAGAVAAAGAMTIAAGTTVGPAMNASKCAKVYPPSIPIGIKTREWRQIYMR